MHDAFNLLAVVPYEPMGVTAGQNNVQQIIPYGELELMLDISFVINVVLFFLLCILLTKLVARVK